MLKNAKGSSRGDPEPEAAECGGWVSLRWGAESVAGEGDAGVSPDSTEMES